MQVDKVSTLVIMFYMDGPFPFVEIPEHLIPCVGLPDPETRIYRAYGPDEAFEIWWGAVCEICHPDSSVSPGGVAMYAKVTRAGIHKRMKEGRITAFLFHTETKHRRVFSKRSRIKVEGNPYIGIPVSECKAWAEQLTGLSYEERDRVRIGDDDHAGQFLLAPKDRSRK